jgi:hypothetical protein
LPETFDDDWEEDDPLEGYEIDPELIDIRVRDSSVMAAFTNMFHALTEASTGALFAAVRTGHEVTHAVAQTNAGRPMVLVLALGEDAIETLKRESPTIRSSPGARMGPPRTVQDPHTPGDQ